MKIGFDLDEVLCNIIDPFLDSIYYNFGLRFDIDIFQHYDFYKNSYTPDEKLNTKIADKLVEIVAKKDKLYDSPPPHKEMVAVLKSLHQEGHEVHIITARHASCYDLTASWLSKEGVPHNSLSLTGLRSCKGATIKSLSLDYFVDDHTDNIESALAADENLHGNIFLVDKPYNRWYSDDRVIRIHKAKDIMESINNGKVNKHNTKDGIRPK